MDSREATKETVRRVPYTCPPVEQAIRVCRDALEDVLRADSVNEAHDAASVAHDALDDVESESEKGRAALREAFANSILETESAKQELAEANAEIAGLKRDVDFLTSQVEDLQQQLEQMETNHEA